MVNNINVFFIRHCYSCANELGVSNKMKERLWNKHVKSPGCTQRGIREAFELGTMYRNDTLDIMKRVQIQEIYASCLPRALVSAHAFKYGSGLNVPIRVSPHIMERPNILNKITYSSTANSVTVVEFKKWVRLLSNIHYNSSGGNKKLFNLKAMDHLLKKKTKLRSRSLSKDVEGFHRLIKKNMKQGKKTIAVITHHHFIKGYLKHVGKPYTHNIKNSSVIHLKVKQSSGKRAKYKLHKVENPIFKNTSIPVPIESAIKGKLKIDKLCNHNLNK